MRGKSSLNVTSAAISVVVLVLAVGPLAAAEEVTRTTYEEAAEPICRANTEANERILGNVRREVKRGELGPAAKQFKRSATALHRALGELSKIPRPPADRARLSRWLGFVADEVELLKRTAGYLAAGQKGAAEGMVVRLKSVASRANNVVFAFEFEYCRFNPARYT